MVGVGGPRRSAAGRSRHVRQRNYFAKYGELARAFIDQLLDKHEAKGIQPLENRAVPQVRPMLFPIRSLKFF